LKTGENYQISQNEKNEAAGRKTGNSFFEESLFEKTIPGNTEKSHDEDTIECRYVITETVNDGDK
jgi:hypothetical protein